LLTNNNNISRSFSHGEIIFEALKGSSSEYIDLMRVGLGGLLADEVDGFVEWSGAKIP